MRPKSIIIAGAVVAAACAPAYSLRPVTGGPIGKVESSGVSLLADPEAWYSDPYDLPEYLTPILVQINNGTDKDIAIRLADFALVDENGFRYAAINPFGSGPRKPGNQQPPEHAVYQGPMPGVVVSAMATSGGEVVFSGHHHSAASVQPVGPQQQPWRYPGPRVLHPADGFSRRHPLHPATASGFYVYPSFGLTYGWYSPWPYDFYYPPDYWMHVYPWAYPYYPRAPNKEILRVGLPEGVLKGGGHVAGFVYFQNAASRAKSLELSWQAHTVSDETIAELTIGFTVNR
jgi:hypothetical protein